MRTADPMLERALATVAECCRAARAVQQAQERVRAITKDDRSPVTVADFAVQAVVALDLLQADGDVHIVGEERAELLRRPEEAATLEAVVDAVRCVHDGVRAGDVLDAIDHCDHDASADGYWTLDPVDGTKGFLRGQQYAVALAWIEAGEVALGVMGCPNLPQDQARPLDRADPLGTLYAATRGGGAWEHPADGSGSPRAVRVAPVASGAPLRICESVEAAHSSQSDTARILESLGCRAEPVRLDSQCKYAVVARGQADAYLRLPTRKAYVEKVWDHAAGSLIAREAGATVSDVAGAPLDFSLGPRLERNRGIVCAVPGLHERIIDAIGALGIGAPG